MTSLANMAATMLVSPVPAPSSRTVEARIREGPLCSAQSANRRAPRQTCRPTSRKLVDALCSAQPNLGSGGVSIAGKQRSFDPLQLFFSSLSRLLSSPVRNRSAKFNRLHRSIAIRYRINQICVLKSMKYRC